MSHEAQPPHVGDPHALDSSQGYESPTFNIGSDWEDSDEGDFENAKPNETHESFRLKAIEKSTEASDGVRSPAYDEDDAEKTAREGGGSRRNSDATDQSFMLFTPDEEHSVVRKFDRRLVLFVALLYMLSFLDRSSTRDPDNLSANSD